MCILRLRNHLCRTALVYVSNKRRLLTDCSSALYRQSLPHVYQLFSGAGTTSFYRTIVRTKRFGYFKKKKKKNEDCVFQV